MKIKKNRLAVGEKPKKLCSITAPQFKKLSRDELGVVVGAEDEPTAELTCYENGKCKQDSYH